ncbi:antitoxin Xre/MbcA/ParS toxin-binding domain-containing protein [Hydrogenophaga sp.]|uniref:antitoxin Xre/MbcA/ParS toxin-binding domain-containing protein n=1 Tax=Hydrogenophaga sp. TaxID=1904254 RepID=UPI002733CDC4|nr:antitoxin Xre/MbcA/ParS toxin-binding domain-containing protein [Hydrogenophaga sp.]MDP3887513.1 DUF2384 domain-containing protein [Hydrogenophaga sp.]MDZ4177374.1 antitoxin Xre/MbcA/ParS toxin-binding domain-containing protein [Hydrogenophaga sp.]
MAVTVRTLGRTPTGSSHGWSVGAMTFVEPSLEGQVNYFLGDEMSTLTRPRTLAQRNASWTRVCEFVGGLSPMDKHALVLKGANVRLLRDVLGSYKDLEARIRKSLKIHARSHGKEDAPRLGRSQTEYLLDLVDVTQKAIEVFGSREIAEEWLINPVSALNGHVPIELLSSRLGSIAAREYLVRVDHGVYT